MKGVWLLPGGSKDVAVKTLKEGSPEEDTVKFLQEAAIHGQFWHPNVVKLMGVVTVGEPVSRINVTNFYHIWVNYLLHCMGQRACTPLIKDTSGSHWLAGYIDCFL